MLPFDLSEYQSRIERTKTRMAAQGIELLLATDPANMNYLTGYDSWSFYVHQLVILSLEAEEPIWVGRAMDANAARVTTYLKPENIHSYSDDYVQSINKHPMEFVARLIKEYGWENRYIGLEMDTYYFTAACYTTLQRELPRAHFKDITSLVNWVRVIKSPAELQYMHEAARIIERAMRVAIESIEPGVRHCDVAATIYHAQISGTPEFGGDYTAICPMLPTGVGTSTPHLTWTDQPFANGDATILELAGARRRYHCPMARTVHLGTPPQRLADTAEVVVEGLNNVLEAAKPGVTCEELERVWHNTIAHHGIVKDSRIGYSAGLNYPPDWGEHTLSLRPGDDTPLQENMTIHCIPGIWQADWGVEISECFRVTEHGGEPFADFPRMLFVKDY